MKNNILIGSGEVKEMTHTATITIMLRNKVDLTMTILDRNTDHK